MTIHFFTKDTIHSATARFRGYYIAKEIKKNGIKTIVHKPPTLRPAYKISKNRIKEVWQNIKILYSLKTNDILYLVRTIYQIDFFLLVILFRIIFRKKYIFDFDDAKFLEFPIKMRLIVKMADNVIVGSHFLEEWAKQYNENILYIPTSIPYNVYSKYTKIYIQSNKIIIGWIGIGISHIENFKIILPVFDKLFKVNINFKFIVIGSANNQKVYDIFKGMENIEFIDHIEWTNPEAAPKQIRKFDIGIMPLIDNEMNRGKCAFKAVEYMACGIPTVCSNVGENKYLIQNNKNGFLVSTAEEWYKTLKNLITNNKLRKIIGLAGQQTIKEKYSIEENSKKIIKLISHLN